MTESVVLDASAILAAILAESGGERIPAITGRRVASTVNMAETRTRLVDRGHSLEDIERLIAMLDIYEVDFTKSQAVLCGKLRAATRKAGLSLGDRACLALAMEMNVVAMTSDKSWQRVDVPVQVEMIR